MRPRGPSPQQDGEGGRQAWTDASSLLTKHMLTHTSQVAHQPDEREIMPPPQSQGKGAGGGQGLDVNLKRNKLKKQVKQVKGTHSRSVVMIIMALLQNFLVGRAL